MDSYRLDQLCQKWQKSTHLLFGNVAFNVFAPTHIKSNLITVAVEKTVRQKGRTISQSRPWVNCAEVCNPQATFPAESQKPRQRVSNADRKVFANPESFCVKFIIQPAREARGPEGPAR